VIVHVNGEPRELVDGATVATVLEHMDAALPGRGVAVAVDAQVVPRGQWERHRLREGDRVEVLAAIQGG
jgi:sulfur carrier protein